MAAIGSQTLLDPTPNFFKRTREPTVSEIPETEFLLNVNDTRNWRNDILEIITREQIKPVWVDCPYNVTRWRQAYCFYEQLTLEIRQSLREKKAQEEKTDIFEEEERGITKKEREQESVDENVKGGNNKDKNEIQRVPIHENYFLDYKIS